MNNLTHVEPNMGTRIAKLLLLPFICIPALLLSKYLFTPRPEPTKPSPPTKAQPKMATDFAVPVLMYHRITDLTPKEATSPLARDLTVSPKDFEDQVAYLAKNGFTFLTADEVQKAISEAKPLPERSICLTMDDGYKDNFENAFPILQKYDARATLFLVTATVGTPNHLSWQDALTMKPQGVGYGSHTVHHFDLTSLAQPTLDFELIESKRILEANLDTPITGIAYPSGKFNEFVVERTKAAGYDAAWKKGGGPVRPWDEPYLLPRVRVRGSTTMKDFKRIVWSGIYTMRIEERSYYASRTDN